MILSTRVCDIGKDLSGKSHSSLLPSASYSNRQSVLCIFHANLQQNRMYSTQYFEASETLKLRLLIIFSKTRTTWFDIVSFILSITRGHPHISGRTFSNGSRTVIQRPKVVRFQSTSDFCPRVAQVSDALFGWHSCSST